MAFRAEAGVVAFLACALGAFAQESLRYEVRSHRQTGTLTIDSAGVSFEGRAPKHWDYQDIQQLKLSPRSLTILTYKDNKWKLGADRAYKFDLAPGKTFADAYELLKARLDQRFVAAIPTAATALLWEARVKRLTTFGGDEGALQAGADQIVFQSGKKAESRTWRYEDIENISSSGPFQLTIVTFERARLHYGDRKEFNFELKQRLEESRYDALWLRVNRSKGLRILNGYRQPG